MVKHSSNYIYWHLDLPKLYFDGFSDYGLLLGHEEDFQNHQPFSGNWEEYNSENLQSEGIVHTALTLVGSNQDSKAIKIPKGAGRFYCFADFSNCPELAYYPSIFEAKKRIVCYCHCTSNWDGLLESSLITIDIDSELFFNQYWDKEWLDIMRKEIPNIGEDVDMWSNGGLQLYLDQEEKQLLIHGDYSGDYSASLLFKWDGNGWNLNSIIPGAFPISNSAFRRFRIGQNSLTRCFAKC